MNERFPDATAEELDAWVLYCSIGTISWLHYKNCCDLHFTVFRSDATCIICREEMTTAKKLLCGHLFHVHCLRSWLERQHTCPTCRAPIIPPDNGRAASARQHGAQPGVQPGEAHFIILILLCHIFVYSDFNLLDYPNLFETKRLCCCIFQF
jgi:E3 ubiquitin-protein ligase synoviolin